jgi:NAD(P)-dependent dehydrogenase (short-subunit alcohol dehydrogenase family)
MTDPARRLGAGPSSLSERVVLVTGATGVLGHSVVARFAESGARVGLAGTSVSRLKAEARALGLADERWVAAAGNLLRPADARAIAATVARRFGRIDILVHLVGGWAGGTPVAELDRAELRAMLDQHVWTTLNMVQATVPAMVDAGWGRVISIMARAGIDASPKSASYALAKAAEDVLLRTLAKEVAGSGVTVNLVTVGTIDESHQRDAAPTQKNATWTTPEEIAEAILYLCSEGAATINGARLPLDRRT